MTSFYSFLKIKNNSLLHHIRTYSEYISFSEVAIEVIISENLSRSNNVPNEKFTSNNGS